MSLMVSRRQLLQTGLTLTAGMLCMPAVAHLFKPVELLDSLGRQVVLRRPCQRMILADGALAYAIALLNPEHPFERVIGWGNNFRSADLSSYNAYSKVFPSTLKIPNLRSSNLGILDPELVLSLEPDVVVFTINSKTNVQASGLLDRLTRLNIAVLFIDFRSQNSSIVEHSLRTLALLLQAEQRVEQFIQFRREQLDKVLLPLQQVQNKPLVMLERAAGLYEDCCLSYGQGNFGELIEQAGGINLGSRLLMSTFGTLQPEAVMAAKPDIVIVTGADWSLYSPAGDWVNLGPGENLTESHLRLNKLMQRPAYRHLAAVKAKRVHAIWHAFYDNPYAFIALQQVAKWLHPELFATLNPEQTFQQLHQDFLPIPYQTGYWVSL